MDPDPWKRWSTHQASMHPFITGDIRVSQWRSNEFHWTPPWDPSICHRKLLSVKKAREKKAVLRRQLIPRNSAISSNPNSKEIIDRHSIEASSLSQLVHSGNVMPETSIHPPLNTIELSAESNA